MTDVSGGVASVCSVQLTLSVVPNSQAVKHNAPIDGSWQTVRLKCLRAHTSNPIHLDGTLLVGDRRLHGWRAWQQRNCSQLVEFHSWSVSPSDGDCREDGIGEAKAFPHLQTGMLS